MATSTPKLDYDSIVRDEYEIQLYGFSIKEFTKENFIFVEQNITKSVKDLNQNFNHLLKDINPELNGKIDEVTKSIVADIKRSCQEDIVSVNRIIGDKLKIPENVLLYADNLHATKPTQADVEALSEECQRLEQNVKENAFFIHSLNAEIETYEQLHEVMATEEFVSSKAEEQLNNNLDADLLLHTARKVQALK